MRRILAVLGLTAGLLLSGVGTGPAADAAGKSSCRVRATVGRSTCNFVSQGTTVTIVSTLNNGSDWELDWFGTDNPRTCGCFGAPLGFGAGSGTTVLSVPPAGDYLQLVAVGGLDISGRVVARQP
jgi:hypothetical protein